MGDLLEIVGEAADRLVVVLGQAGEEGQLVGEGAGGGWWAWSGEAWGPGRGQGGVPEAPRVPEVSGASREHTGVCPLRSA